MRSSVQAVVLSAILGLAFVVAGASPAVADPRSERAAADEQRAVALAQQQARASEKRALVQNAKAKLADRLQTVRQAAEAVAAREAN